METVKKILKLVAGMLVGAAVGYFGVMVIIWLVEGSLPSAHGGKEGIQVHTGQDRRGTALGEIPYCGNSPIKCAVLYAYELLHNHDAEKADIYKRQLEAHKNDYTMPGEALTAIRLIENIEE